jgi:periplasmic divalent cation tolerance protein
MAEFIMIHCTVPSEEVGFEIARRLLDERAAACVQVIGGMTSFYCWQGEMCSEKEHLLQIKSQSLLFSTVKKIILSMHPYEVPEIMAFPVVEGHGPYLEWMQNNTN